MIQHISDKLREAEIKTELQFPKKLFDFIRKLEKQEVLFGEEEWIFPIVTDIPEDPESNFIISKSEMFSNNWGLKGLVFAVDGNENLLLALQKSDKKVLKQVFVLINETSEIKIFNYSLDKLLDFGPIDYIGWDDYYLKFKNGEVISGDEMLDDKSDS